MGERIEALVRLPLAILYSIILGIWGFVVEIVVIFHWFYALIFGKRSKSLADFANTYVTYQYDVNRYLYLVTNERAWPAGKELRTLEPTDLEQNVKAPQHPSQL
ncbi:hypothetical protein PAP_02150 [Palaeococcus pacificus DY20341]|uniref:DUF4389 domain-containing protein n=1 Tax=Palaeococcus pacificus DY20341 TaxID=1343739 RepID=A0A075LSC9_9EURY|nr:DUF4389 domain-containing protein [Palaeococcus pacificus]AIF68862.1 hypothetical protein PAP_02150 [Palaeococcus pacificus DY20341]